MATIESHQEPNGAPGEPVKSLRRQRLKTSNACEACRLRKCKCDGRSPACSRCISRGDRCLYNQNAAAARPRRPIRKQLGQGPNHPSSIVGNLSFQVPLSPPTLPMLMTPRTSVAPTPMPSESLSNTEPLKEDHDSDTELSRAYCTDHGRFAGEVVAAIGVRAGVTSTAISHPVPFVDAPLFGPLDLDPACLASDHTARALPSRADAERLADIYFDCIDPVEPVLDRTSFYRGVETAYHGPAALFATENDIQQSIMNLVFALAVQRQESIPQATRQDQGNLYFKRAWVLLRPEIVLWQSTGSIELVQCLILMNRYLHCTSHQQKAWMTSGLAHRIAQGLCCHLPGPPGTESASDRELKWRVWASCVALDRCMAWSQGKSTAQFLTPLPSTTKLMPPSTSSYPQDDARAAHLGRVFELHEIGNQIQLAQTQIRNRAASNLGLPRLYQQDEYHAVAVQLDACLNKWEGSLPDHWKAHNLRVLGDRKSRVERYLLHLRLLHTRIFMHRPILARFYSMRSHTAATPASGKAPSLSDRLFRDCAGLCVDSAQALASLVVETLEADESLGLLPWWYRVYYLHIAGTTFLAAMFVPELYTDSVAQSWRAVVAALRNHQHLSAYVQECICTFETLSARILTPQSAEPPENSRTPFNDNEFGFVFDDLLGDAGLDFDGFIFTNDGMAD